jgi:hypothetical protein
MKTVIEMAREAGLLEPDDTEEEIRECGLEVWLFGEKSIKAFERFAELVRADEREQIDRKIEEFARKWWKIHCDSNLHYSSTLKAHQDFCALQAAIRNRSNT